MSTVLAKVASLPALAFDAPAPMTWEAFEAFAGKVDLSKWSDLETQLKNAVAEARGGEKYKRRAKGCSLFWKNRVLACFQEKDVLKRDAMLDRVWWDAAEELIPPAKPLSEGALAAYAVRLKIAIKRSAISEARGSEAFDALTAETKVTF